MAAINLMNAGISVGVGVVDEVLERMDAAAGRTAVLQKWSDYARLLGVLGGYSMVVFGRGQLSSMGETIATSMTPLLVKTLAKAAIKPPIRTATASFQARRIQEAARVEEAAKADWQPSGGRGYRSM